MGSDPMRILFAVTALAAFSGHAHAQIVWPKGKTAALVLTARIRDAGGLGALLSRKSWIT